MPKVVVVGKPSGNAKPQEQPVARNYRDGFITRIARVVISDIKDLLHREKLIVEDEPEGWEDYKRFCELARGKK